MQFGQILCSSCFPDDGSVNVWAGVAWLLVGQMIFLEEYKRQLGARTWIGLESEIGTREGSVYLGEGDSYL